MFTSSQPTHDGLNSFEFVLSFVKIWCLQFVFYFGAFLYFLLDILFFILGRVFFVFLVLGVLFFVFLRKNLIWGARKGEGHLGQLIAKIVLAIRTIIKGQPDLHSKFQASQSCNSETPPTVWQALPSRCSPLLQFG